MADFAALDVAVGLIFLYVSLAFVCATLNETIATAVGLRARYLEKGLVNLLSGAYSSTKAGEKTADAFYAHPLVQGLIRPRRAARREGGEEEEAEGARDRGVLSRARRLLAKPPYPSYIPSRTFVVAITDLAKDAQEELDGYRQAIAAGETPSVELDPDAARALERFDRAKDDFERALAALPNAKLSEALLALYRAADRDAVRFHRAAEEWFDDSMERVSGWYKRRVHLILAVIAAIVVTILNADTLAAGKVLWRDDAVRAAVVAEATQTAQGTLDDAKLEEAVGKLDLPLGWDLHFGDAATQLPNDFLAWVQKVLGLLLTVGAIQLGAPFWFDLLSKIVRIRSTGAPPPASDAVRRGEGEQTRRGPSETVEGGGAGQRPPEPATPPADL